MCVKGQDVRFNGGCVPDREFEGRVSRLRQAGI